MKVKFWGTRGSIATPQPGCMRYGGDTSCVEVRTSEGTLLILDAGTGIRRLGESLMREPDWSRRGNILLSHAHWDHIQGIPFFGPAFDPRNEFHFYGQFKVDGRLEALLRGQMEYNYFPVCLNDMGAQMRFTELVEQTVKIEEVEVSTCHLPHPQGCFGYRIDDGDSILVYATDNEFEVGMVSDKVVELARDADLLIYDTMYDEEEFQRKRGWGHSTWRVGVEVARKANVRTLCLYHHNPEYEDPKIDSLLELARSEFPNTIAASRDLVVDLAGRHEGVSRQRPAPRRSQKEAADFSLAEEDDVLTVTAASSLERFKSEEFRESVLQALRSGLRGLFLDLDALEEIDSLALGSLAAFVEKTRDLDVPVFVKEPEALVKEVLMITRFNQVLTFVSDRSEIPATSDAS